MASGGSGRDNSIFFIPVFILGVAMFLWFGKDILRLKQSRDAVTKAMSGDKASAEKIIKDSSKNSKMAFALARCYWQGGCAGIEADPSKALDNWIKIADMIPEAAFNVGLIYEKGMVHGKPDVEQAKQYYSRVHARIAGAAFRLGQILEESNPEEALKLYMEALSKDSNPMIAYKIGWLHYRNGGLDGLNTQEALKWFSKAAMKGFIPDAMYMMGYIHMKRTAMLTRNERIHVGMWYMLAAYRDKSGQYRRKVEPFWAQLSEEERARAKHKAEAFISSNLSKVRQVNSYDTLLLELNR